MNDETRDMTSMGENQTQVTVDRIDALRVVKEVEGAIVMAKKFPRDITAAHTRIMKACKRKGIAKKAMYSYPRAGKFITGPTIRLTEVLAQNFGNLQYTIRELERFEKESEVEASCWDLETNFRSTKTFKVKHIRDTTNGPKALKSERDIYEIVANMGSRRGRACILSVIPSDVVQDAIAQCEKTLVSDGEPIDVVVRRMLPAFSDLGVTKDMIETYLKHSVDTVDRTELLELIKIFNSVKEGVVKRTDFFKLDGEVSESDSNGIIDDKLGNKTPDKPADKEPETTEKKEEPTNGIDMPDWNADEKKDA